MYMIIVTDGAQGGTHTAIPRGPELARVRTEEARCAANALGIHAPIFLGFPDGKLGDYTEDPARLFRLTQRMHEELQRLAPDALITWGPDGGTGHPDHRIVSNIVTQLVRAGAPGIPERLFYAAVPLEVMRAINPGRGEPPMLIPLAKHFNVRVPFTPTDFEVSGNAMRCHKTQLPEERVRRIADASKTLQTNGVLPLAPALATGGGNDVFNSTR